ncbi:MAG TPA: sugar transporter, partial [Eubacteriaceae bacterium]|nr:sugar transporter [Eubacteriaceae bacterium]
TAGVIVEKTNMRWGKYRSWLLVGPIIAAIFYAIEFLEIGSHGFNAITIIIGFGVSHLIWNTYYTAHIAMNNSMTVNREERVMMSANRGIWNGLGILTFSYFGVKAIPAIGEMINNETLGFTYFVIGAGVILVLFNFIYFKITKPYAYYGEKSKEGKDNKLSLKEMLQQIIVNPPLIGLLLAELGRYLGRFIIFGMAFYYFKYVLDDLPGMAFFMTGLTIVNLLAAMIASPIARRIGEKKSYIGAMVFLVVGLLATWAIPMGATTFKIVMFIAYVGYGLPDAIGVAMYSATVDYGEWKTGKNARGFIMSLLSFPIKTAVLVRSVIITAVLASANYVADMAATPQLIDAIKTGFALYPAIIMAVGLVLLALLYRITPEGLQEMNDEIADRKQQNG